MVGQILGSALGNLLLLGVDIVLYLCSQNGIRLL